MHKGKWWEIFGDPQLNAIEDQIEIANQSLAAEEATYRSAQAAVRVARSGYYPSVTAGASLTGTGSAGSPAIGSRASQFASLVLPTIGATWTPDLFGSIHRMVENAADTAQATEGDLENMRLLIQSEVALDYFQLHGLDAQKILLD